MSSKMLLTLKTNDGVEFMVEESVVAVNSNTIKSMVEESVVTVNSNTIKFMVEDDCASHTISLPNVDGKTMAKIIEYWKRHSEEENKDKDALKAFDKDFLKVHMSELFDLLLAANYLDSKELCDVIAQEVADRIKNESPEQVRQIFKTSNDFTPDEEEEIRKKNAWAFDI